MEDAAKRNVVLTDGELLRRAGENRSYLMSLDTDNLLLNYRLEAGRTAETYGLQPKNIHGGWEFPTCQLRGHFLGHWLSAAALEYARTGDRELLGKAEYIVDELALCQKDNGDSGQRPFRKNISDGSALEKMCGHPIILCTKRLWA